MAYFSAIARNLQQDKDQKRKEQTARRRYALDQSTKKKRENIKANLVRQKEKELLEKEPHRKLINAIIAEMNLPPEFRKSSSIFKNQMDQVLSSILRKKKQKRQTLIDKAHQEIMKLSQFSLNTRYDLINYVNDRTNFLTLNKAKVVTPI